MSNPIEIIQNQMELYFEGEIMKAVMRVDVNVDKEELIKLLERNTPKCYKTMYFRNDPVTERVTICPVCHNNIICKAYEYPRFCAHCGQAIKYEEE